MWKNKTTKIKCKQKKEEKKFIKDKSIFQAAEEIVTGNKVVNVKKNELTVFDLRQGASICNNKETVVVEDLMSLRRATTKNCINIVANVKKPKLNRCITVVET